MNTIGNLGGAIAGLVTGAILKHSLSSYAHLHGVDPSTLSRAEKATGLLSGYQISFVCFAAVYILAILLWLRIDSTKPLVPEDG
jgi:hypothetical protein